ncbi:HlyD family type I secretion periplasmic adaptor subunit [Sphingomonas carotinifaciens]|uniref:Membrane fusion protein (MFP) family protein n=1 Tax=Sphingomonas carotinifaciens TaxID=1166323 RepID=A0A1G7RVN7_9SPHN|nr:HlyD family type I secretion periplasmic adaptor subunit [Sphingomonas carotinifaciens]MBB4088146.1 HlyD family secretion protein [Sphingomonas carotinifaciens]MWC44723.1 HlyD family type I secretion periplasmic adaptor subunit [Sphingomonas carotinifaciens]SDG14798.1 HlyD family secretion protein [Sphingomonas carotinifaciens]
MIPAASDPMLPTATAQLQDSPQRALLVGGVTAFLFFVVLIGWSAVTRLDAAAFGQGQVVVAGNRKVVQNRAGGNVETIAVREGQHVAAGQVLVRLSAAEAVANERALASTVIDLQAQRARLQAEIEGGPIRWPAEFAIAGGPDRMLIERAQRLQLAQARARGALLAATRGVLGRQRGQIAEQRRGFDAQVDATSVQRASLQAQLESTRRLAEQGVVSRNSVRALERSIAELAGSNADYVARNAALGQQIAATQQQTAEVERKAADDAATLLRDTQFRLNEALPRLAAARDQVERTMVRAPVAGRVVNLRLFSPGAVVQPGQDLLEIVPDAAPLVVSARFAPEDIDGVAAGREAEVKFLSLHERDLPMLVGTIHTLSADSLHDQATGASYFTAEIVVPDRQVALLRKVRGADTGIRPGVPVQVTAKLRPRTALQYFLDPLTDATSRSFHER